jgi:hypothetical protein
LISPFNFAAKNFQSVVHWKSSGEPPATIHLSGDELKGIIIDTSDKLAGIKG